MNKWKSQNISSICFRSEYHKQKCYFKWWNLLQGIIWRQAHKLLIRWLMGNNMFTHTTITLNYVQCTQNTQQKHLKFLIHMEMGSILWLNEKDQHLIILWWEDLKCLGFINQYTQYAQYIVQPFLSWKHLHSSAWKLKTNSLHVKTIQHTFTMIKRVLKRDLNISDCIGKFLSEVSHMFTFTRIMFQ